MYPYIKKKKFTTCFDIKISKKKILKLLIFTLRFWLKRSCGKNNTNGNNNNNDNNRRGNKNMKCNSKCDTRSSSVYKVKMKIMED